MDWDQPEYHQGIACYHRKGPGPCILWLHGYTMNATVWKGVIEYFPQYSHLAIDLPGHGLSAPISTYDSLPALARHIVKLGDLFGVSFIVALSFGGLIGIQMAIEANGRYSGLVLNSSPYGGGPFDEDAEAKNMALIKLYRSGASREQLCDVWMRSPPAIFEGAARHPALKEQLRRIILLHSWKELDDGVFFYLTSYRQNLGAIRNGVLLLIGEMDMEKIKRSAEIIKRSVFGAIRVYVPDCGHLSILEAPEHCVTVIKQYLEQRNLMELQPTDRR